ncbi:MAG: efflux RND transporter periplasmic adaptor subunit [Verrucomicrobiota bacterium]
MKRLLLILLLLSLGGGAWWYFNHKKTDVPEYNTESLGLGDITQVVTATGALKPVINVTVGCQISGTIDKLNADFNSVVKEGEVLASLDPATYEAIVQQAEGELANAKATLELAELTAQRKEELFKQKAAPQADVDTAHATLHQALAGVAIREGSLKKARVDLSRCTIYSPIDGTVISRSVDVGQTVAASLSAQNLFTIANDMTSMQISASVSEADIGMVATGQAVEFTVDAFPYTPFTGVVEQIRNSPVTVQSVVTYDVLVAVKNPELKLKPGMTANVSITVAQRKGILRVSNAALRFRLPDPAPNGDKPAAGSRPTGSRSKGGRPERKVHLLKPDSTQPVATPLKLGISDNIFTEVLSGVSEGDTVVVSVKGAPAAASPKPAANPLGGPQMRTR